MDLGDGLERAARRRRPGGGLGRPERRAAQAHGQEKADEDGGEARHGEGGNGDHREVIGEGGGAGGRYDNLAEYYTDRPLPGVGISIGLTRLFYVLNEQRMLNEERVMAPADVMIVPMTDDLEAAVRLATELRAQNIRVQLYAEQKKFKAKIQYADKLHIPYVVFLGEDEIAAGTVSLKDLRTGDQVTVPAQDAAARILADIELRGQGTILK